MRFRSLSISGEHSRMRQIVTPVLIIVGNADQIIPVSEAHWIKSALISSKRLHGEKLRVVKKKLAELHKQKDSKMAETT